MTGMILGLSMELLPWLMAVAIANQGCFVMDEQACVPYGTRCLHDGQLLSGTRLRGNRVFLLADLWPGEFLGHTAGDISPACCPE